METAGDIVTGGLVAGTVEGPRPWWRRRGGTATMHAEHQAGACRDCGTQLVGAHCHACGQAGHLHTTLGGFAHEVVHGVFHFEGKIWRTLPMLVLHPGHLTRRYVDGERTKFVTPMALFLFSVFLMFAIVSNLPMWGVPDGVGVAGGFSEAGRQIRKAADDSRANIARLQQQRAVLAAQGMPVAALDAKIRQEDANLRAMEAISSLPGAAMAGPTSPKVKADRHEAATGEKVEPTGQQVENWAERTFAHAKENPKLFIYKMKSAGYKYSWALIPISLPFIWIMFFWKRRFGMYDHAVFATYSLAFMSLMTVVLSLMISFGAAIIVGLAWTLLFLIPPIHMYKQLKYGYLLSRFGAAWRTFVLLNSVITAAVLFFLLLLYLGSD